MNHSVFRSLPRATVATASPTRSARGVHRAIGDIRRGVAVAIECGGETILALPAETATADTLAEFLATADSRVALLLAASRADRGHIQAIPVPGASDIAALPLDPAMLRVESLRALADPTEPQPYDDLVRGRVAVSIGAPPAKASVQLVKLARLLPAMLVGRVKTRDPSPDLLCVSAADVLAYPSHEAVSLVRAAEARVPLDEAEDSRIIAFRPPDGGIEHLAILVGRPESAKAPLVRVHSECFTGDLLGSRRCDCGPQLHQAIRRMAAEGAGVLLYMAQEGRGIGLVNKLRAYTLQDSGLDTVDANRALGFGADERSFAAAAAMLRQLNMCCVRLLTNNPHKMAGLAAHGIDIVGRVSHAIAANGENDDYLATKALRFGHLLG
jgi:GTP cyclohydrolase II